MRSLARIREAAARRSAARPWIPCDDCGSLFQARRSDQRFCSAPCRQREAAHRRRAQYGGGKVGRPRRFRVLERDEFCCALCGCPLDMEAPFPEPMSATVDHIVPVSLGGAHTEDNMQAAHFFCNTAKGARI